VSARPEADADIMGKKMFSRNTRHSYRIFIRLPEGYGESDRRHDVLYLLDGDKYFADVAEAVRQRPDGAPEKDLIIVGTATLRGRTAASGITLLSGCRISHRGRRRNSTLLRAEHAPLIDREYRTNADRGRLIAAIARRIAGVRTGSCSI
jgi:predicted alpha/beta superfamily hydrolase